MSNKIIITDFSFFFFFPLPIEKTATRFIPQMSISDIRSIWHINLSLHFVFSKPHVLVLFLAINLEIAFRLCFSCDENTNSNKSLYNNVNILTAVDIFLHLYKAYIICICIFSIHHELTVPSIYVINKLLLRTISKPAYTYGNIQYNPFSGIFLLC